MRLSRRVSLSGRQGNRGLGSQITRRKPKKHKKLDDICENVYSSNHKNSVKIENNEETEPRRSTRVRRAPVVLDASPSPAKKRRVEFRREKVKKEPSLEKESGSWGDRLRDRARKGKRPKRDYLPRTKRRLFKVEDMDFSDDVGVESSMSRVVKSKRPGRIKASNVSKNAHVHVERDSSPDEGESSESNEDLEEDKAKSESSDREENDKVDKGDSVESDEDGESDEAEEGETSESDEDGEESEKDKIGNHAGKKEARKHREKVDVDMGHSSESDEDDEESEKDDIGNYAGKKEARKHKDKVDVDMGHSSESEEEEEADEEEREPSESEEEEEQAEENEVKDNKCENGVGDGEENDKMDVLEEIEKEEVKDNNKQTDEITNTLRSEDNVLVELEKSIAVRENQMDFLNVEVGISNEKPVDDENVKKSLCGSNERRYLRVGRRCGLCGTGTNGKPPKTLVEYGYNSDHEVAYSGSSASEDIRYDTNDGFGEEPGWLGHLLGPINDRYGIAGIFVHQNCAVWSPEVYFSGLNCLKNVRAALFRGRVLKCTRCSRPGATSGCRVDRCPKTYHLPCARANGCIFDHKKFLIACTDHRHLFQPHGIQSLDKIKKMKEKKLKFELRKVSGDAWRKDLEAEEKYLENCGEDEEFLKRESKRLHRDLLRIAPVYIGGSKSDNDSQFQGFESVAGLQNVIQSLKEVVILPLLYPEFFSNMGITPPRGVLLHGYPGTGKTLVVRALIGSCAQGDKRIAYFARKGADCLGKYVGDAERQLRLLFQVAEKSQPSIIFFDEIDGLAPCRTRQSDQTHNSVVSTLLALMDGLKSRGSVVVIGATNRPDYVDSALRRPGRFDREIYFPLPSEKDREAILSLHTRKWPKPVTGSLLKQIAKRTVGFAGADLQSLCTQAAITALRRSCPLQEILSAAEKKGPLGKHPPLPSFSVEERDWLEALTHAPPPCSQRGTEMAANDVSSSPLHTHLVPCLLQPLSVLLAFTSRDKRIYLPSQLYKAAEIVKSVVVSALERKRISASKWWSHVHEMVLEPDVLRDVEINLCRHGILTGQENYSSSIYDEKKLESHCPIVTQLNTRPGFLRNATCASDKKMGFFLLISGNPRSGQRYLASCLLHCFTGNVEIQKLDSATISQEGQGDLMLGVNQILRKCASVGSSLIFMPRIDLWAIDTYIQLDGVESNSFIKKPPGEEEQEVPEKMSQKTSVLWDIFVEQVESISVSSSLTILATSALPSDSLPGGIKQFFKSGKLSDRSSSPFEETIPRFSLPLDGRFNNDNVVKSSTTELLKDLAQQFVQLSQQRVHVHSTPYTNLKSFGNADKHKPADENVTAEIPESSVPQFSSPANSRPSKGKSNLMLTISTLGYQILTYPHFAELCWATSKLKEGPCTYTRGPWKGWPFNPCIVRPDKSSTHVAVTCSSNNLKNRENYGLVRGLIAVGLLAYRGTYATVREVSSEVRKVLELLADQINAKICAGKDPSQYIRILSQMAYFEDVVNSWAYSLQSLEETAQITIPPTPCFTDLKSCDHMPSEDVMERKDGDELDVSTKNSENTTAQKDGGEPAKRSGQLLEKSTGNTDLNKPMEQDKQGPEGEIFANKPPEKIIFNHPSDNGVCTSILPNRYANTETVIINEDGPRSGNVGSEDPNHKDSRNQHNEMTIEENVSFENGNSSSTDGQNNVTKNSLSNDSRVICFYRCCSECLIKLREKIGKILAYEWGLRDDGDFTVEDVHDLVASVSMNLHSNLRKIFAADWHKGKEEMKQDNSREVFENQEKDTPQCKGLKDGYLGPQECRFHPTTNQDSQQENDLKFVSRDGVMSQLNMEEVAYLDFHCKFDNLCLCSLIESIVMTKQP